MAAINRDPNVTRYLNRPVDEPAVQAFFGVVTDPWNEHGFGFYAVESGEPGGEGRFIGFVGVAYPTFLPELAQRPELGWRLASDTSGRGLATEAAAAARDDAFQRLALAELISIIHPENTRPQRLATKLGMSVERQIDNRSSIAKATCGRSLRGFLSQPRGADTGAGEMRLVRTFPQLDP